MNNLSECIESIQSKLERHKKADLKETPTRNIFIDPLLQALGWDVSDWDKVQTEYPTIDGKSVDYACKIGEKVVLLIEAKQLNDPLTDVKAITQVVGYAANDGVEWCILTNGEKYKIYCTREKGAAPDKLLFEISLNSKENGQLTKKQIEEHISRFSYDALNNGELDQIGEEFFTKNKIRKALDKIFADPPGILIKKIRETINDDAIKPSQIKEMLNGLWNEKYNTQISIAVVKKEENSIISEKKHEDENGYNIRPNQGRVKNFSKDTIVVPAQEEGFNKVFIGENRWYAIRIHPNMIKNIKYIAAYQAAPISAVTYLATVKNIEPWENSGKYVVNFTAPAKEIKHIELITKGEIKAPQSPRYTNIEKLKKANNLDELF
jgi:hypothetical protein